MKPSQSNSEPEVDSFNQRWVMEVRERARAEERLLWEARVDASRAVLHRLLISPSTSMEEVAGFILSRAKKLTGSPHGFISVIDPHTGGHVGYAQIKMLDNEGRVENTIQKFAFPRGSDGSYPELRGASLTSGKAFYSNAPHTHPMSGVAPVRPISWERFLSVPILLGSQVTGLIVLSKAEKDYDDQDLAAIQPLAESLALVIQRSRNETALQRSEAFNRSIIDNSPDCINVLDLEGRLEYMSQGGQEQMGIKEISPYLNTPYEYFWKNKDKQGAREAISKARQGETSSFQGFCPTLEGVAKWWDVVVSPIRDNSGEPEKLLAVSRDISERKGVEEALQEADRFNHAATDALSAHLAILDKNGVILMVNRAWRDFARANAGEKAILCEGVNYLAICDGAKGKESEEAVLFAAGMRAVLQEKQGEFALEYPCHAPHEKRWFMGRVTHFKSKGEIYLVVAHEDITQSKQAELRQSARSKLLEVFSKVQTLEDISAAIIPYVEQIFPGHPVSICQLDESGRQLHYVASIGLPDFYNQAIEDLKIGAGVGSCGAAAYTGQRVVVEDIQAHPNWTLYKELAARAGLGACWSEPILSSNGKVLGTFAVYDAQPAAPDINDLRHLEDAARLVGLVLERKQADEALRQSHAQLEQRVEERTAQLVHAKHRLEDKITELEQAQDFSRDLAARYRIVADNTYDWEFWLDLDGQFLYSSPSCRRITGYDVEDFLRDPTLLEQMIHPDDLAIWLGHSARTAVEKTVKQIEFRIFHKDGSICWIEHICQPVFDEQGQYLGNRGSNRDISQRKQGQEALRRSESRFQQMVESITTYIYTVKVEAGRLVSTLHGPGCLGLTGYSADEFAADADLWLQMVHPEDRGLVTHQADRVLTGATVLPLEHRMFRKDGSICWVKNMPIAQFNKTGDLTGYDGMITDISERKLAQQALLESHHFNHEIIAGAGEGIFALDSQLNYMMWNPFMEKLTGIPEKDMLGKKVLDISPALQDQGFFRLLKRGLLGETVISPDFRYLIPQTRKSGWLSGTCTPRHDNGGNITGVIVVLRDINARKQAEEDIRSQSERAETLLHVAARLNVQLDLDTLLRAICEEATTLLHAPAAWICLYEPKKNTLCYGADYGMPPEFKEGYKALPRGLYGNEPAQRRRIILTPDIQMLTGIPNGDLYTALDIRTLAIGTIQRDDHLIGALSVISYIEERTFSVDEQALLQGVSDLAAQAIVNSRQVQNIQRHLNLQRALHQIDLMITSAVQLEPSLKTILQLIAGQLNVDGAMVLLVNPQSEALDDIASYGFTVNQPKIHLEKGESYASRILLECSPIYIPDLTQAENWVSPTLLDLKKVVCYYGTPLIVQDKVIGVLELFSASPFVTDAEWTRTVEALATQTAIAIDNATLFNNLKLANIELSQAYDTTLEGWSHAMDLRDKETEGHTLRVTAMSVKLAGAMGLGKAELLNIRRGALLHDMGKMGIPDAILLKPEPLTDAEWIIMRMHPVYAHDMLSSIAYLHAAIDIPYCHHEKWDGSGYPRGLKGKKIPLAARIFAIVDVWDALTSNRPYRDAWSTVRARQHIQELAGSHFEPRVVTAFLEMLDGYVENKAAMALPEPA